MTMAEEDPKTPPAKPPEPADTQSGKPAAPAAEKPAAPAAAKPAPQAVAEDDEPVFQEPAKPLPPPEHPATFRQKAWLAVYLLLFVALLLPLTWYVIDRVNALTTAEVSIGWEMPPGVTLNAGPAAFRYDPKQKRLVHYGAITPERKLELRALFAPANEALAGSKPAEAPAGAKSPAAPGAKPAAAPARPAEGITAESSAAAVSRMEALRRSYNEAIDNLAYLANVRQGEVISLLLLLGIMGGALGAVLRSLVDFVGNACYTQQLDLHRWWPLYFTRPLVGAILGFVLVVLFKAQLLTAGDARPGSDSFWWLGMAVLGGFSTVDVTLRLRLAAKALFGVGEKKGG